MGTRMCVIFAYVLFLVVEMDLNHNTSNSEPGLEDGQGEQRPEAGGGGHPV